MSEMTKSEWIESEYKKWEERFVIPFEDEFNVKALLGLRYQFESTPEKHVKEKTDLLHAMERLQRSLKLEEKRQMLDKQDIVFFVKQGQSKMLYDFLTSNLPYGYIKNQSFGVGANSFYGSFTTASYNVRIYQEPFDYARRIPCDMFFNMAGDENLEKLVDISS